MDVRDAMDKKAISSSIAPSITKKKADGMDNIKKPNRSDIPVDMIAGMKFTSIIEPLPLQKLGVFKVSLCLAER